MKKLLLLTTVLTTLLVSIPAAHADRLDKSSPKIAHGMYREIDKSSPKIAHGMYRDRGKSSPKIAHGMYREIDKSSPKIAHGIRSYVWEGGGGFNMMNKEIDKSSPKIAERMMRSSDDSIRVDINNLIDSIEMALDRGKSSPKIAEGTYKDRGKSSPKIAEGMYNGRDNFDNELLYILENFRSARGGR